MSILWKKRLKKHKNKKKEKENPTNALNNFILNNSQINFGNSIGNINNINTIKNIRNNPNNSDIQPKEKKIFLYIIMKKKQIILMKWVAIMKIKNL